jgi:hypothetical protein
MYKLRSGGVIRLTDYADIPDALDNRDWRAYLEWLALGNTPDSADPPPVPIDRSDLNMVQKEIKALALCVAQGDGITPAQMQVRFKQKWDSLP